MTGHVTFTLRGSVRAVLAVLALVLAAAPADAQRWGRPRTPRAGACFYQNANYRGDYFCVQANDAYDVMPEGLNDRISSIRLFGDADVTVYRNPNFRGRSTRFSDDVSNLQQEGWNDTISSLRVRLDFARVSRSEAEDIVRRAYQAVLGRDPDPGARGWVDRVMRDRWTQRDVERELRKSSEYRNRRPPP
ncbi:MAG: peptidase inhibitor family I36 protein [Acidobacteria bacterium]|nr:peptidase inhibitor family I36 protein [Acidobacteriota bacterium]